MFIDNENRSPKVVVIGGPNGAGKSTVAQEMIPDFYNIGRFINADIIAKGLAMFDPDSVALKASRVMLEWLDQSAEERVDFAFETTLASRTLEPRLRSMKANGYEFHLIVVWVPSPEYSIHRIVGRVKHGGHYVPDDTVRRRYAACFKNFFSLYRPLADAWTVLNNTEDGPSTVVAQGRFEEVTAIKDESLWRYLVEEYSDAN